MKGSSCALVASVLAASTVAISDVTFIPYSNKEFSQSFASSYSSSSAEKGRLKNLGRKSSQEKNKFAARFDGLRFIETLVTAHR